MYDVIILAVLIDIVFGELPNRFHPVAYIGKLITFYEKKLYNLENKLLGGFYLFIFSTITVLAFVIIFIKILDTNKYLVFILKVLIVYFSISIRGMIDHALGVYRLLTKDINLAKEKVKLIVSRDIESMGEGDIIKSTIESIAENFNDAFFAPIFYGLIFGIYGMVFYRVVNTLDAMVGYKNKKYIEFGKFSAKCDDMLNFIPARLQIFVLLPVIHLLYKNGFNALNSYFKYKNALSSPNSGYGISIFAGALNVTLGGDTYYFGKLVKKPLIVGGYESLSEQKIIDAIFLYLNGAIFCTLLIMIFNLMGFKDVPFYF
ncbi:cobalamin biosynthesis protein CobD [Deferribacteraceae bacterium V6Fe1]|nr:cobalamin biosynthesis protein CobD [Deferribacteraceae bacterium V6Fe1]